MIRDEDGFEAPFTERVRSAPAAAAAPLVKPAATAEDIERAEQAQRDLQLYMTVG